MTERVAQQKADKWVVRRRQLLAGEVGQGQQNLRGGAGTAGLRNLAAWAAGLELSIPWDLGLSLLLAAASGLRLAAQALMLSPKVAVHGDKLVVWHQGAEEVLSIGAGPQAELALECLLQGLERFVDATREHQRAVVRGGGKCGHQGDALQQIALRLVKGLQSSSAARHAAKKHMEAAD